MDRTERYRTIVQQVVAQYANGKPANGEIETEVIVDTARDRYVVMDVGWDEYRRVHFPVIHIDIIDGKVWVQHDGTDRAVAEELVAAGIPKQDIVLGFHPARVRHHTEYAVG